MTELIDQIDDLIAEQVDGIKAFGLVEKVTKDNAVGPVKDKKKPVSPNDKDQITTYHRLLTGSIEPREDLQFGKKLSRVNNQKVRMVVFIQKDEDDTLIDQIWAALPTSIDSDDYRYLAIQGVSQISRDDESIWQEEFDQAYLDRVRMKYILYAIEYELQYQLCA